MNERISPHKTWEGFFGGWVVRSGGWLDLRLLPSPLLGLSDAADPSQGTWYWMAALCSRLAAHFGFGRSFLQHDQTQLWHQRLWFDSQGHGGIVDRVGSDMFTCMFTAMVLIFITNGWNFFA
jgi:CDP-diglyceride synthetase